MIEGNQQTIYVEPDEEITLVVDKIKAANKLDIVLVVPRGSVVTQSLMNLKLIHKTAREQGKTLGLVTQDSIGRQLAQRIGLPVYESVEYRQPISSPPGEFHEKIVQANNGTKHASAIPVHHFQNSHKMATHEHSQPQALKTPQETMKRQRLPRISRLVMRVIVPLLTIGGLYFLLTPKAQIMIVVSGEPIERELSLTVDSTAATVSPDGLLIPGELVEVTAEATEQFPATAKKNVGEKATGKVTFSNRTGEDVIFASGSKLKTSTGLIYLTSAAATVKAAVPKIDPSGQLSATPGQATVEATAEQAGEKYNLISPTTLTIVDLAASKQDKITAETVGFQGGSTKDVTVVAKEDIDLGKRATQTKLEQALKDEAVKKSSGKTIIDGAYTLEVTDEQIDHNVSDEADAVSIKLKGKAKAIGFSETVFRNALTDLVKRNLSDDQDVVLTSQDQVTTVTQSVDFEQKKLVLRGKLAARLIPKINQDALRKTLAGKSPRQATEQIKTYPQIKSSSIQISPNWYTRLPYLASRISISIQHD